MQEFFEEQAEAGLLARTGRSRASATKWMPTRKEWEKMNGKVILKTWPNLPTIRDRLKYLQGADTAKEFVKKLHVGYSTYLRWLQINSLPNAELNRISEMFSAPNGWLRGQETEETQEIKETCGQQNTYPCCCQETEETHEIKKGYTEVDKMQMTIRGSYFGHEIARYVSGLCENRQYTVSISVEEAQM